MPVRKEQLEIVLDGIPYVLLCPFHGSAVAEAADRLGLYAE
jgi:hypothetical protein